MSSVYDFLFLDQRERKRRGRDFWRRLCTFVQRERRQRVEFFQTVNEKLWFGSFSMASSAVKVLSGFLNSVCVGGTWCLASHVC